MPLSQQSDDLVTPVAGLSTLVNDLSTIVPQSQQSDDLVTSVAGLSSLINDLSVQDHLSSSTTDSHARQEYIREPPIVALIR